MGEPCSTGPCGTNAECESTGRTAICKCPRGYSGDPYTNCRLDPCSTGPCADNAICENSGNAAVCKCPPAHTGDPYINCRCLNDNQLYCITEGNNTQYFYGISY